MHTRLNLAEMRGVLYAYGKPSVLKVESVQLF